MIHMIPLIYELTHWHLKAKVEVPMVVVEMSVVVVLVMWEFRMFPVVSGPWPLKKRCTLPLQLEVVLERALLTLVMPTSINTWTITSLAST